MNVRSSIAAIVAATVLALGTPTKPAVADGAASTRNLILLGGAAAAYLIVRHNRAVHEREAANAVRQAAQEERSNDAWAAYRQAERAYRQEAAANAELQKELSYQRRDEEAQRKELTALGLQSGSDGGPAMVSYGWGAI
jgi:hypothetical protein